MAKKRAGGSERRHGQERRSASAVQIEASQRPDVRPKSRRSKGAESRKAPGDHGLQRKTVVRRVPQGRPQRRASSKARAKAPRRVAAKGTGNDACCRNAAEDGQAEGSDGASGRPPPRAARPRHAPSLDRSRRQLPEVENNIPTPPSSLDLDRTPSAARSGRHGDAGRDLQHNETSPELTGGDVDANWEDAYPLGTKRPAATIQRPIRIAWTTSARRWASSTRTTRSSRRPRRSPNATSIDGSSIRRLPRIITIAISTDRDPTDRHQPAAGTRAVP